MIPFRQNVILILYKIEQNEQFYQKKDFFYPKSQCSPKFCRILNGSSDSKKKYSRKIH